MPTKVRVSAVSYLNSVPFVYGLEHSAVSEGLQLVLDIPSVCANKLIAGEVDLGLVPVAIIPSLPYAEIITPYCIGADGPVETVCLFSEVPLSEIETILLDYHSKTSVQLVQLLANNYWNINVVFEATTAEFEQQINGNTAGVVIGDRAYQYRAKYVYVYDLSEEWKKYTGLPFVFACWVANKPLPLTFKQDFSKALSLGLEQIDKALQEKGEAYHSTIDKKRYLTEVIQYDLSSDKQKGLNCFLEQLANK